MAKVLRGDLPSDICQDGLQTPFHFIFSSLSMPGLSAKFEAVSGQGCSSADALINLLLFMMPSEVIDGLLM